MAESKPEPESLPHVRTAPTEHGAWYADRSGTNGSQSRREETEALSQLYDRYSGILKALILRVIHNETEADDLLQEIFMEIWNQAKNFSPKKVNRWAGW